MAEVGKEHHEMHIKYFVSVTASKKRNKIAVIHVIRTLGDAFFICWIALPTKLKNCDLQKENKNSLVTNWLEMSYSCILLHLKKKKCPFLYKFSYNVVFEHLYLAVDQKCATHT